MGIIMMVGIVVSNGVLLVEYTNELRRHGLELHEAVVRAGRTRLRPIIMTSLTTVVGLIADGPGIDVGSEANAPLARAVIGGLTLDGADAGADPDAVHDARGALPETFRRSKRKGAA